MSMALTACQKADSSDVNQNKIYAEYELFYDKDADKTYASAIFKFNSVTGTQLQLTPPSEIKFGSDAIPWDPTFAYYRKEYAGQINSGTFTFKDSSGVAYSNTVNLAAIITNPVIDTIHKSGSFTYTWVGNSISANEAAGLTIAFTAGPTNFQYFYQNTVGSTNFVLSATKLNLLPNGPSTCTLERSCQTTAPSVTSAGGVIRGKYRALNTSVYIAN